MRRLKLSSIKGLAKLQWLLVEDRMTDMMSWLKSGKKAKSLMEEVHKHIFDQGPPTPPGRRTGRTLNHQWLMLHVNEIQTTLDTMRDIKYYIGQFPYSENKVAKHRYLQFHIEAFLQEIYILQLRLVQFATLIERKHKKDPRHPRIKAACPVLQDYVVKATKDMVDVRGSHVHKWRFSDNQLDRLNGISFYTMMPNEIIQKTFKWYYESEYRKIRKQRREWVAKTIEDAQKLIDAYFDAVFKLLFDGKGRLVYPSNLKF